MWQAANSSSGSGGGNSNNTKQTIVLSPALKSHPQTPLRWPNLVPAFRQRVALWRIFAHVPTAEPSPRTPRKRGNGFRDSSPKDFAAESSVARHYSKHTVAEDFHRRKLSTVVRSLARVCATVCACVKRETLRPNQQKVKQQLQLLAESEAAVRSSCRTRKPQNRIINKEKPSRRHYCFAVASCWHGLNGGIKCSSTVLLYCMCHSC